MSKHIGYTLRLSVDVRSTTGIPQTGRTIQFSIRRPSDGYYWNGSTWVVSQTLLTATQIFTGMYVYQFNTTSIGSLDLVYIVAWDNTSTSVFIEAYSINFQQDVDYYLLDQKMPLHRCMGSSNVNDYNTYIEAIELDTNRLFDNPISTLVSNSFADKLMNKNGSQTYDKATDSLEAISDKADAIKSVVDDIKNDVAHGFTYGTVSSGLSQTSFQTDLSEPDDFWIDMQILFLTGNNAYQSRRISDFDNTNGLVTIDSPLYMTPSNGDTFVIVSDFTGAAASLTAGQVATAIWQTPLPGTFTSPMAGFVVDYIANGIYGVPSGILARLPSSLVSGKMDSYVSAWWTGLGFSSTMISDILTQLGIFWNTAIPGTLTADSPFERLKTLDDYYTSTRAGYLDYLLTINGKLPTKSKLRGTNEADGGLDTDDLAEINEEVDLAFNTPIPGTVNVNSTWDRIKNIDDDIDQKLSVTESNIRGSDSDDLKSISDQLDLVQGSPPISLQDLSAQIGTIQNAVYFSTTVRENYQRPESGSVIVDIKAQVFNGQGAPEDPDGQILQMRLVGSISGEILPLANMDWISTGLFHKQIEIFSTDILELWEFEFHYSENTVAKVHYRASELTEYSSDLNHIEEKVDDIWDKVGADILTEDIPDQIERVTGEIITRVDTAETNITEDIAEVQATEICQLGLSNPLVKNTGFGKLITADLLSLPIGSTIMQLFNGGSALNKEGCWVIVGKGTVEEEMLHILSIDNDGYATLDLPTVNEHAYWSDVNELTYVSFFATFRKLNGLGNTYVAEPVVYQLFDQYDNLEATGNMVPLGIGIGYGASLFLDNTFLPGSRKLYITTGGNGESRQYVQSFDLMDKPASDIQLSESTSGGLTGSRIFDQDGWYDEYGVLNEWPDEMVGYIKDDSTGVRQDDVFVTVYRIVDGEPLYETNPPAQTISDIMGNYRGSIDPGTYLFTFVKAEKKWAEVTRTIG